MPDSWDFSRPQQRQADPLAQMPMLTYLLAGLSVIITGCSLVSGGQSGSLLGSIGSFGYAGADDIWSGRLWGLVTTVFIHGSVWHLFFNMVWLVRLGRILESTLPPAIYVAFIIAAAAIGSTTEILVSGQTGIGMSGVVYAMFGLMWGGRGAEAAWRGMATRDNLRYFIGWGLLCIVATQFHIPGLSIANGAHAGGFLFGLCIGYVFYSPRRRYLWGIPLALLLASAVIACTWMPWSGDWTLWRGNRAFDHKQYARAIRYYQESLRHGGEIHANWYNISHAWNNIAVADAAHNDTEGAANALSQADSAMKQAGPGN